MTKSVWVIQRPKGTPILGCAPLKIINPIMMERGVVSNGVWYDSWYPTKQLCEAEILLRVAISQFEFTRSAIISMAVCLSETENDSESYWDLIDSLREDVKSMTSAEREMVLTHQLCNSLRDGT